MHTDTNKPLFNLTIEEFESILDRRIRAIMTGIPKEEETIPDQLVYGIDGIARLFNVSRATAQRYKDTFLRPCIRQNGRKIVCSRKEALDLFEADKSTDKAEK